VEKCDDCGYIIRVTHHKEVYNKWCKEKLLKEKAEIDEQLKNYENQTTEDVCLR
jgi:hypothetical protein